MTLSAPRIAALRGEFAKQKIDAVLITDILNVGYLTGIHEMEASLLVTGKSEFIITDSRYIEDAGSIGGGARAVLIKSSFIETAGPLLRKERVKRLGVESRSLSFDRVIRLKKTLQARISGISGLVESQRVVKTGDEIAAIKKAAALTQTVFDGVTGYLFPGSKERDIAAKIEMGILKGEGRPAFAPIIASGSNSSKPHARPTSRMISRRDMVMIDMGSMVDHYNSDLTRIVLCGMMNRVFKDIYDVVWEAQNAALSRIRPGAEAKEIDSAARSVIGRAGYGNYFGHALGHGIGLAVHEEPSISSRSGSILKEGMVFTVEPGIYLPGKGGIRLEDMVLVTGDGCEILTSAKHLKNRG